MTLAVPVITLIGSSSQKEDFDRVSHELTMQGYVVISLGVFLGKSIADDSVEKALLGKVHRAKIDLADIVYVIEKADGTLGTHALRELKYALKNHKEIWFNKDNSEWV